MYRDVQQPLLPWVVIRAEEGRVAGDLDVSQPTEPRIAHYCVQTVANLACDDKPERADEIPTFDVSCQEFSVGVLLLNASDCFEWKCVWRRMACLA